MADAGGIERASRGDGLVEVALIGMRFHVLVGILPHEREHPQPLEVDVTARVGAGGAQPLDYRHLYEITQRAVSSGPLDYLEDIAASILDDVLGLSHVASARVSVRKPAVALPGPLQFAQVTLERANG